MYNLLSGYPRLYESYENYIVRITNEGKLFNYMLRDIYCIPCILYTHVKYEYT